MKKIAKKLIVSLALVFATGLTACGNKGGESGSEEAGGDPVVTFRLNYKTGEADIYKQVTVKKGECVEEPEEPEREDYIFDGWHYKFDADSEYDFEDEITKSIKIFAHWLAKLECTFDLNYDGAPAASKVEVIQKSAVARPADPVREGYQFIGWTINKEEKSGDDKFEYYDFARLFTEDLTLYAQWGTVGSAKSYRFEAEFCDVITKGMGMTGNTYSGSTTGLGLIGKEPEDAKTFGCSNGFFVHHLYATGNNLKFEIKSSVAGTAKIKMRLSAEYYGFRMNSVGLVDEEDPEDKAKNIAKYPIIVNGNSIDYGTIEFTNVPLQGQGDKPFETYLLTESVELVEGKNTIEMKTDNKLKLQGTAIACAPMIDCLTFETNCDLSWMNAKPIQAYKAPTNN